MNFQNNQLEYISLKPWHSLEHIVESIWMVINNSDENREGIIVPDGKIDLFLFIDEKGAFEIFICGVCTEPVIKPPFPKSRMFAISFYPTAAEYIFNHSFSDLKNTKKTLPDDYWGFSKDDLIDFECFYKKACYTISSKYKKQMDGMKQKLFELISKSRGEITVKELAGKICWSSRQINRYFQNWLGLTLKSYVNIVRFSNSLKQLKEENFYPELNYGDQSHFIREVKKYAGVTPTILSKNENDRFIQLNLIPDA
ncbi:MULTISPECIES: helix-turn-helix domain-containing protein [Sphingobacterium]|uniref:helix-turn-helix domain-containing protein n=1 Tax=Sphingobacterium TaxID=28453 RepID=UPI00257EA6FC|nr:MULTISPECIES: AraC family transcriptional regulator [Sphingobacterium]